MKELWRIDKDSIQWKFLQNWSSHTFLDWLDKISGQLSITKDNLKLGIAESIRKIEYLTLRILKEKTNKIVFPPPNFIITSNPHEIAAIQITILQNNNPDFFCTPVKVKELLGFAYMQISLMGMHQALAGLNGGIIVRGTANEFMVGYYDAEVIESFRQYILTHDFTDMITLLAIIIEETFHYFCYQTGKFGIEEMQKEKKERFKDIKNRDTILRIGDEIEKKFGVKQMVAKISAELKDKKSDLFSPLWERIE